LDSARIDGAGDPAAAGEKAWDRCCVNWAMG
jgi:hypothetical protein